MSAVGSLCQPDAEGNLNGLCLLEEGCGSTAGNAGSVVDGQRRRCNDYCIMAVNECIIVAHAEMLEWRQ